MRLLSLHRETYDSGQFIAADINRNGLITVNDMILLRNHIFDGQYIAR